MNSAQRPAPQRPDPERTRRLDALAELHDDFVRTNADTAAFRPEGRRADGDYPLHHVDLDAPVEALDDFHRQAAAIFGAAPGGTPSPPANS